MIFANSFPSLLIGSPVYITLSPNGLFKQNGLRIKNRKPKRSKVKCWWGIHIDDQLKALLCSHILLLLIPHHVQAGFFLWLAGCGELPAAGFLSTGHWCFVVVVEGELCWANSRMWSLLYPDACHLYSASLPFDHCLSNNEILCFPPSLNFIMKMGLESRTLLLFHLMNCEFYYAELSRTLK